MFIKYHFSKLKEKRESLNLTLTDVAIKLNLSSLHINSLEQGENRGFLHESLMRSCLRKYINFLGLTWSDVVNDKMPIDSSQKK